MSHVAYLGNVLRLQACLQFARKLKLLLSGHGPPVLQVVMCITQLFISHITAPHIHDMNIYHDMMSQRLLHANHNQGAGNYKQVIITNYMWQICILTT